MYGLDSPYSSTGSDLNLTIHTIISNWAKKTPNAVAIAALERYPLTFSRLNTHIEKTVKIFTEMGISRKDRIAIVLPNGPEIAVAFLTVASGAICAPLNPAYKTKEFEFYLSDLKAKALLIQSGMDSPAINVAKKMGIRIIQLSPLLEAGIFTIINEKYVNASTIEFAQPEDIALVLHTSGTTSRPKIVPLTHKNICTSANNIRITLELKSSDCGLNIMPLFHIHGLIGATLSTMLAGASIVCTPGFYAPKFFEWIKNFQPTWYTAVPTMHQAILMRAKDNQEIIKNSKLRFIRSSSSSLPPQVMSDLEKNFNVPVIESYGMTEAAHQIASNPLPPNTRKSGSVGIASGPEIAIMDDEGNLVTSCEMGEIVIRGPSITKGYEHNPEANQKSFTNGWFRTGDQGYCDKDNYLRITDRIKEIINRGGEKVSPREIDEVLLNHPKILQAVTFSVPHPKLGEEIAAAVVLQDNETTTEWEIQKFLADQIADFKIPRRILILDEIPKGSTGKIQRIGLAEKLNIDVIFEEPNFKTEYKAPSTTLEKDLVNIWSTVLELDRVGINDNFFQLGGDSIQAGRIIALICEMLQVEQIPLVIFLHAPTIDKMARILENKEFSLPSASLIAIQNTGSKPPIYCVHGCRGDILTYTDLAQQLGPEQPFYGLRAQGLDGKATIYTQVEDMAAHYVREIQAIQPEGPYFLGGASTGGNIALEMAQQLISQGKNVGALILMEPVMPEPSEKPKHFSDYLLNFGYYLRRIVHYKRKREVYEIIRFFLTKILFPKLGRISRIRRGKVTTRRLVAEMGVPSLKIWRETLKAVNRYIFKTYPFRIILYMSEKNLKFPGNPKIRIDPWIKLFTGPFEAQVVPGQYLQILKEPNVQILAQHLRKYLNKALMEEIR